MHPVLFEIGWMKFHGYPTMLALAFLVGVLLCVRDLRWLDPPIKGTPMAGLWIFLGALVGARAFWIIQFAEVKDLWQAFVIWYPGLVYYGGLIGGVFGAYLYIVLHRLPPLRIADVAVPYLALSQAITRVGCFLNGCCWGRDTHVAWAVQFPKWSFPYKQQLESHLIDRTAEASLPVHPTQLYMVIGLVIIAVILKLSRKRRPFIGAVGLLYCFFYGLLRFIVEALRGDSAHSVSGMTVSQVISLLLVVGSVVVFVIGMFVLSRRSARLAPEDTPRAEADGGPPPV